MAQQVVNIGSAPNDGTGDTLRDAFDKVNDNDAELYSLVAGSQPLDDDLTAIAALTTTSTGRDLLTSADAAALRAKAGLGTLATQNGTFSGTSSGTNTGDQTTITGNAGSSTILAVGRTIAITGDLSYTSPSFNGSANVTATGTLATVNSNVGSFGSATQVATFTVNAKGLTTAAANVTITPAATSITSPGALTKTDDTNVTLTLGGTPTTALLRATSITVGWTGTLAVSRGGTGDTGSAWTTYTPSLSAGSGSFTSATATGRYKTIGKTVFLHVRVNITTNGTAAGSVRVSAPFTAGGSDGSTGDGDQWPLVGRESKATGIAILATLVGNSSTLVIQTNAGAYPGADGYVLQVNGSYEAI